MTYSKVEISYYDITSVEAQPIDKFKMYPLTTCLAIGWVVQQDESKIYLAQDIDDKQEYLWGICIPKGCIKEIKEV